MDRAKKFGSMRGITSPVKQETTMSGVDTYSISEHLSFMKYYVKPNRIYFPRSVTTDDFDFLNCHVLLNQDCEQSIEYPSNVSKFVFIQEQPLRIQQTPPPRSTHSFVLQMLDGNFLYASCAIVYDEIVLKRVDHNEENDENYFLPRALCFTSRYPIYTSMQRILEEFCDQTGNSFSELDLRQIALTMKQMDHSFDLKPSRPLRQIVSPEIDFSLLFRYLPPAIITKLFALIISEMTVAICSKDVTLLTPIMEALLCLMHPLKWTFPFLPVLPRDFIGILAAPQPLFVGIPYDDESGLEELFKHDHITFYDIDSGKFKIASEPECHFPQIMQQNIVENTMTILSSGDQLMTTAKIGAIRWEFLRVICELLAEYEEIVKILQEAMVSSRGSRKDVTGFGTFLNHSPPFYRPFLSDLVKTQHFQQFIEERSSFDRYKMKDDLFKGLVQETRRKRQLRIEIDSQKEIKGLLWRKVPFGGWRLFNITFKQRECVQESEYGFCKCSTTEFVLFKISKTTSIHIPKITSTSQYKTRFPFIVQEIRMGMSRKHTFCALDELDFKRIVDGVFTRVYQFAIDQSIRS